MTLYRPLVEFVSAGYALDPNLVEAVVIAESSAQTDAFRHEPGYFTRYLRDNPEYAGMNPRRVASSYGLMQVMYPTAQQYGFTDQPEALFVPDTGLRYGCIHLKRMLEWAQGDVRKALAAYNGGKGNWNGVQPQRYATRVLKLYDSVRTVHPAPPQTA